MTDKTLVEAVAVRFDFDGYGYQYMDAGSGSDWLTRKPDAEPLFSVDTIEALQARVDVLEAELAKAKVPQWFYHPDYTEVCEFSPWDVIDGRYDPEPGNHVFEIECARPLPSIWCAVRVTADPDADERFTFTEHSSEAEARAALEGSGNG